MKIRSKSIFNIFTLFALLASLIGSALTVTSAYAAQTDINGPAGSGSFGTRVVALPNGNFVVTDPSFSIPSGAANVGAVYLYNGATLAVISTLKGSTADDQVGSDAVTVLTNGNFVVTSSLWDNPTGTVLNAGAVTWCSAVTGCNGVVSAGNSLVGGMASDVIGINSVTALTNGNYVVSSPSWDNPSGAIVDAGAATWGNGNGGTVGLVTSINSLIGGTTSDFVGIGGVTALPNSNYVVSSSNWDNPSGPIVGVGAVTWGDGDGGTVGLVSPSNSLIGGTASDFVSSSGVTVLTTGNYVVRSQNWDNPSGAIGDVGAVTWGNGNGGTVGAVSSSNSLIGGTTSDAVGNRSVTALSNGNYVVSSPSWDNPSGAIAGVGAATWANGNGGTVGLVSSGNSLIGGRTNDNVGSNGVTALTNGNYVVSSRNWDNPTGSVSNVGAATWGNGTGGTVGLVTSGNSLFGSTANDLVGNFGVTALTNGNYIVQSANWNNPAGAIVDVGAATWGNGNGSTFGPVGPSNSLIGGTPNDLVGGSEVTALSNGNYVVSSPDWDNPNGSVSNVGAVTWGNGNGSTVGLVTPSNSLIGGAASDKVGFGEMTALTNGNYVVASPLWDNPAGAIVNVGAVTWGNGSSGTVGLVTPVNSLVGGTANDQVGDFGTMALTNGSFAVAHPSWDNPAGAVIDASAVTLANGIGGTVGLVTSANSVLGTVASGVSDFSFDAFRNRLIAGRGASNIVSLLSGDAIAPIVSSITRVNANPTNLASVNFTVNFSEPVTGVDVSDFSLTKTGASGATVSGVSGTGSLYTVTVNTGTGNGTIRLNVVDNNSIVDGASNPLGGAGVGDGNFITGEVYTITKSAGGDTTGVFRPSNGLLYLKNANTSGFADVAINYGLSGDYPVAGDWDGNGTATIGIYRNGSFYLRNSNTLGFADLVIPFGTPGDQPVVGDWNGDGVDTIGVYSNGQFRLRNSNSAGAADMSFFLGNPGDVGIAGDWNGDGLDTTGVFRPSNGVIFLKNLNTTGFADIAINYGLAGDMPVTGDWNNDGIDTIGVYRNAQFLLRNSNTIGFADIVFALGNPGDMPIAGNWDGIP
ncbi:MAG: hypothetical protein IPJ46_17815 [Anaerolineales bacterium]|nr:hypothetical protein [Anaerolineales bacterium]